MTGCHVSHRPGTNAWIKAKTHRLERRFARMDLRARVHDPDWDHPLDWEPASIDWDSVDDAHYDPFDHSWDDDRDRYEEDDPYYPWDDYPWDYWNDYR